MRTPAYGVVLIAGAMVLATVVLAWTHPPVWVRVPVLLVCLVAAAVGFVMTLRDLTPPRRR